MTCVILHRLKVLLSFAARFQNFQDFFPLCPDRDRLFGDQNELKNAK